ncbi:hypothetical protein BV898_16195 [Hypsibius exemplaris]|uniref:Transmembrane protein 254 n=1 Tax=Hypsibius exemplaris TaxID=2072580 RepID=A0A9X6RKX4_HYPEX|nr:hypothetical protein BV898_16195 [Hypsibius exemplaris]
MPPLGHTPMKRTFFQATETRWMIIIASGLGILLWSWLSPETIPGPYGLYLGPIGLAGKFIGSTFPGITAGLVYMAAFLHLAEALFAAKLCYDNKLTPKTTAKWILQTLLFGIGSLGILWTRSKAAKRS